MKIITQRNLIMTVCDNWRNQYRGCDNPDDDQSTYGQDKREIYLKLKGLDLQSCSADDVNEIIGNSSWTIMTCNECEAETDWVIEVGNPPDYESRTARLCRKCAASVAKALIDSILTP